MHVHASSATNSCFTTKSISPNVCICTSWTLWVLTNNIELNPLLGYVTQNIIEGNQTRQVVFKIVCIFISNNEHVIPCNGLIESNCKMIKLQ